MLIAVDHGNKQIKTVHTPPFTSGLIQSDTPGFGTDALAYRGKYYTLTDQRIPYRRDKTEDERFFILTLFAIAHEIEAMGQYSGSLMRVQLAVGLPPAHFGVQARRFINYFNGRGAVAFQFTILFVPRSVDPLLFLQYPEELSLHSPRSSYYFLKILHKLLEMQNSYNPQHLVPNNH